ncbi:MAG TPA: exodeoxyribonuclease VII large subunit, partial [Phycisphaerales bacterium]|nr:exodeoxyribonuclease VII large subunit [Phycisphaerales bacterium]
HWYFELKDAGAVISCVMFATAARRAGFVPEPGQEVVVGGRVEFWAKTGRTQFYAETIEPVGAGALDLKFRRLCEELRGLGWFAPERKRPLPVFPRRVAVITSRSGAALQDVLDTLRRRCPAVGVVLLDVRVQGERAAEEVARALGWVSRHHAAHGVDAVVLTRGGGSREDLWTFNERVVAEAVVGCAVPVVAAIGHETDTTIAELCADERGATPTQAAMRVAPDAGALLEQAGALGARLAMLMRRRVREERERLRSAARHPCFSDPRACVSAGRQKLREGARHLLGAARARLGGQGRRLEQLAARLERHRPAALYARRGADVDRSALALRASMTAALHRADLVSMGQRLASAVSAGLARAADRAAAAGRGLELVGPVSVLRRGFSCTLAADGTVIRSAEQVSPGEVITTRLAVGEITSGVLAAGASARLDRAVERAAQAGAAVRAPQPAAGTPPRRSRRRWAPRDQMDLFPG